MSFVVLPPGVQPPPDETSLTATRSGPGQLPAAATTEKRVVTRRVVDPERQKDLQRVKVGDSVTGTLVEVTAVSLEHPR